jgi:hypothetical protein
MVHHPLSVGQPPGFSRTAVFEYAKSRLLLNMMFKNNRLCAGVELAFFVSAFVSACGFPIDNTDIGVFFGVHFTQFGVGFIPVAHTVFIVLHLRCSSAFSLILRSTSGALRRAGGVLSPLSRWALRVFWLLMLIPPGLVLQGSAQCRGFPYSWSRQHDGAV